MPKRARSYFGPPVVIISIAQQARPKVAGEKLALRMEPATPSTVVSRTPLGSFSSRPTYLPSVPVQAAPTPDVGVGDEHGGDEDDHLHEAVGPQDVEVHRPRVEEDDLDVEDDEHHRGDE